MEGQARYANIIYEYIYLLTDYDQFLFECSNE